MINKSVSGVIFAEDSEWYEKNRRLADRARVGRAVLSTGDSGVLINYSGMPIVLTCDEATRLATQIIDQIELSKQ